MAAGRWPLPKSFVAPAGDIAAKHTGGLRRFQNCVPWTRRRRALLRYSCPAALKSMITVDRALTNFVRSQIPNHNDPALLQLWLEKGTGWETQINVHSAGGEPVDDKPGRYTDGVNQWGPLRIPWNASKKPHWRNFPMPYALDRYADSIGWTGFDWKERKSYFVGFDFDGLTHEQGLSPEQLDEVWKRVSDLPYVIVRRSTSGSGLHVYAMLNGVPCSNHMEHSRKAKVVLRQMSRDTGFDLSADVDCFGSVLWFWSRRATKENRGFELVQK
jgi:hypothetical protein